MTHIRIAFAALLALGAVLLTAGPAAAISLEAARSQGLVGETRSGYVAPVVAPSAEVKALIESVNAKRREVFLSIAGKNGISIEEVGAMSSEKVIDTLPAGAFYQGPGGGWTQR